jgi:hypothetical protein
MVNPLANDDDADGIKARQSNVDEYKAAYPDKPAPAPKPATMPMNKPTGKRYGDKPGEKRINVSDMIKPLGSYKDGTNYVPKTGHYKLHEGEAVVPKKDNPMKKDMYGMVTGDDKPPKKIKHIVTRKTHSGSYIHEHHHHAPEHHPMEEHTSADAKAMAAHMSENAGGDSMTPTPPPAGPAGMPQGADGGAGAQSAALGM